MKAANPTELFDRALTRVGDAALAVDRAEEALAAAKADFARAKANLKRVHLQTKGA